MTPELPTCDDQPLWDLWLSSYHLPAVAVADELGIFDALQEQADGGAGLAGRLGYDERALSVLLSLLAALGFLALHSGRYHVTDVSRNFLLHDSPFHWGGLLGRVSGNLSVHATLRRLVRGDRSEETAVSGDNKRPVEAWESGQLEAKQARHIAAFMHSHSMPAAAGVARNGDFSGVRRLLDVGGGSGCFSISLARQYPDMHCTVMELPAMCEVAREYIAAAGMADRVDTVAVDMFRQDWPGDFDALFFSNIFHDWDFDTCLGLARKAHAALKPGGRICLHEMLLNDDGAGPLAAATFSLVMLLGTQGQQFTFDQLRGILEEAGFTDIKTVPSYAYYSLVSGRR